MVGWRRLGRDQAVSSVAVRRAAGRAARGSRRAAVRRHQRRKSASATSRKSPYNVVHLTLPESDAEAGRLFREWREQKILVPDEAGFWALSQDYVGPDGVARTRTGLVGSLKVEPYETGTVLPHERTHRGPKEGRLRILREVGAQLEPIFLLHEGERPFDVPERTPDLEVEGTRLWRLDEAAAISEAFADRQLLIADGHHRYETALAYHEETGTPASGYMLVVLVSVDDPGLEIFPTHRVFGTRPAGDSRRRSAPGARGCARRAELASARSSGGRRLRRRAHRARPRRRRRAGCPPGRPARPRGPDLHARLAGGRGRRGQG